MVEKNMFFMISILVKYNDSCNKIKELKVSY